VRQRGRTDATRTVKNHTRTEKRRLELTLREWLVTLGPDERAVPDADAVFGYAHKVGIPPEYLELAWKVFKARFIVKEDKRQKDWRATFRNYVKCGWLDLWYINKDGAYLLTQAGLQAQREHCDEEVVT
jgi:hypothetical protein